MLERENCVTIDENNFVRVDQEVIDLMDFPGSKAYRKAHENPKNPRGQSRAFALSQNKAHIWGKLGFHQIDRKGAQGVKKMQFFENLKISRVFDIVSYFLLLASQSPYAEKDL